MSAFRACVVVALFIVAIGPSDAAATEDAAIGEANRLLYTNRQHALMLLEEAADRSPRDVNVWAELIHALEVDSANAFAERASRTALRLNPDDPALLLARARILRAGPALDVLTKLGHLPGASRRRRISRSRFRSTSASLTYTSNSLPTSCGRRASLPRGGLSARWKWRMRDSRPT